MQSRQSSRPPPTSRIMLHASSYRRARCAGSCASGLPGSRCMVLPMLTMPGPCKQGGHAQVQEAGQ